jgi:hypothetical protein
MANGILEIIREVFCNGYGKKPLIKNVMSVKKLTEHLITVDN